jgi:hypothetical protein
VLAHSCAGTHQAQHFRRWVVAHEQLQASRAAAAAAAAVAAPALPQLPDACIMQLEQQQAPHARVVP